jgi:hypothetical protein
MQYRGSLTIFPAKITCQIYAFMIREDNGNNYQKKKEKTMDTEQSTAVFTLT